MTSARVAENELVWAARVVPEAHVERLATIALLAGLHPRPVDACSVLELGGDGGRGLVPMALALPNSRFVAVASGQQASAGQRWQCELQLANLELWQGDGEELPESLGSFDYVIVHGAHCFTSASAREAALRALNRRLSPSGIGYVSFKSQPGAFAADAARRLIESYLPLDGGSGPRATRIRRIAALLAASLESTQPLTLALKLEFEKLALSPAAEPWRDAGEPLSQPLYFHDFAQAIAPHALTFFAEAVPGDDDVTRLSSAARDALSQFVTTSALWQQSLDLYSGRAVRHALVCKASHSASRASLLDTMRQLVVGCAAQLQILDGQLRLQSASKAVAHVSDPGVSRAFVQLSRSWPEFLTFSGLVEQISRDNPAERAVRERELSEQLHQLFRAGMIELRLRAPSCTRRPGERPLASPLARLMASQGEDVINQHQERVRLPDSDSRTLLLLCDGGRTREQLLLAWPEQRAPDLEAVLERLAQLALIVE